MVIYDRGPRHWFGITSNLSGNYFLHFHLSGLCFSKKLVDVEQNCRFKSGTRNLTGRMSLTSLSGSQIWFILIKFQISIKWEVFWTHLFHYFPCKMNEYAKYFQCVMCVCVKNMLTIYCLRYSLILQNIKRQCMAIQKIINWKVANHSYCIALKRWIHGYVLLEISQIILKAGPINTKENCLPHVIIIGWTQK